MGQSHGWEGKLYFIGIARCIQPGIALLCYQLAETKDRSHAVIFADAVCYPLSVSAVLLSARNRVSKQLYVVIRPRWTARNHGGRRGYDA